jgi:type I restriction enzyme M protein
VETHGDERKLLPKEINPRLNEIANDSEFADERRALEECAALLENLAKMKGCLKSEAKYLNDKLASKYAKLTEDEIKQLVVDEKWLFRLADAVNSELDRVSQSLTGRVRLLAERYATPLPTLTAHLTTLANQVEEHLKKMGAVWK